MTRSHDILHFWIDDVGPGGWYASDEALDARISERFGGACETAAGGGHGGWMARPDGTLALLILLDQFPRNIYRGTAQAFATDGLARARAKQAIGRGLDLKIAEPERQFFYLPLMHSESLADQELCVAMLLTRLPETGADNLEHGVKHREVIRRFGRFPSRNAALGRRDTEAERAYRAGGGYMG